VQEAGGSQVVVSSPARGGARGLVNEAGAMAFMWVSIFWMTMGSSMQAMTFIAPPQAWQVSISMSPRGAYFW